MELKDAGAYLWVKKYNEKWIHSARLPVLQYQANFMPGSPEKLVAVVPSGKILKSRTANILAGSVFRDQYSDRFPYSTPNTRYEVQLKLGERPYSTSTSTRFDGIISNVEYSGDTIIIKASGWMEVLKSVPATVTTSDSERRWFGDNEFTKTLGEYKKYIPIVEYLKRVVKRLPPMFVPPDTRETCLDFLNARIFDDSKYEYCNQSDIGDDGASQLRRAKIYNKYAIAEIVEKRNLTLGRGVAVNFDAKGDVFKELIDSMSDASDRNLKSLHDVDDDRSIYRTMLDLLNVFSTVIVPCPRGGWYMAPHNYGIHFFDDYIVDINNSDISSAAGDMISDSSSLDSQSFPVRAAVMPRPSGEDNYGLPNLNLGVSGDYRWENGSLGGVVSAGRGWPFWIPINPQTMQSAGRIITAREFFRQSFEGKGVKVTLEGTHSILPFTVVRLGSKINDLVGKSMGGSNSYYGVVTRVVYSGQMTDNGPTMTTILNLEPMMTEELYEEVREKGPTVRIPTYRSYFPEDTQLSGLNYHLLYNSLWVGGKY